MYVVNRLLCCVRQFSRLTWLILFLSSLALTLIVVPGEFKYIGLQEKSASAWEKRCGSLSRSTHEWHSDYNRKAKLSHHILVMVFEHGWPKPFLARARVMKETETGPDRKSVV